MFEAIPYSIQQAWIFVLGCCLGSFFNVVIHRLPLEQSLVHPGSHCPHCHQPIAWYDNIPVVSFIMLMGKCRHCRGCIAVRYPAVEALTGGLFLLLFRHYGWEAQFFVEAVFISLLIIITFIDLDTYTIPDVLSLPGLVVGFLFSFVSTRLSWSDSLLGILLGGGVLYLIAMGYQILRRQEGLGGGDIKLLGMIGAFVGWPGVVFTILVSSIVGTLVGLPIMWRTRKGMSTMLPFGPFLSLGAVVYIFWGDMLIGWYMGDVLGV